MKWDLNFNYFMNFYIVYNRSRQTGARRPTAARKDKSLARELVLSLNGIRPSKEKSAARVNVNVARPTNFFLIRFFFW